MTNSSPVHAAIDSNQSESAGGMDTSWDVVVVGAGLAGASAAHHLTKAGLNTLIVDERIGRSDNNDNEVRPFPSGTDIGWGLMNPMMAKKGRPVWRVREAFPVLEAMGTWGGTVLDSPGLLRPAKNDEQARHFQQQVEAHPDLGEWLSADAASSRDSRVQTPFGALWVRDGRAANLRAVADRWRGDIPIVSARVTRVSRDQGGVHVGLDCGSTLTCARLVWCIGAQPLVDFGQPPNKDSVSHLGDLNLHPIKGQIARLSRPSSWSDRVTPTSAGRYLIDDGASVWVGSTFEHAWDTTEPESVVGHQLQHDASLVWPDLAGSDILEARSGFRVTVPGTRLPMVGPLDADARLWVMTGFGAKGLILSALLGAELPSFFNDLEAIPDVCRVVRRSARS